MTLSTIPARHPPRICYRVMIFIGGTCRRSTYSLSKKRSSSCFYLCKVEVIAGAALRDSQSAMLKLESGLQCDSVEVWAAILVQRRFVHSKTATLPAHTQILLQFRPHILILHLILPFNQSSVVRVFYCAIHAQYLGKLVYQT